MRPTNVQGEFGRLLFGGVVTEGANENVDSGNLVVPTHSKIEYATKKLRSAMDITRETLEENIEGEGYQDTVMNSLGTRIGVDLELLAILGDTVAYAADDSNTGRLLKHNNGWFKLAISGDGTNPGGHTVDCAGATISKTIFSKMIRALPVQFKQNRAALRIFASPSIIQDYRDNLANRLTSLGDQSLVGADPLRVFGVPIVEIPLIPEDMDSLDGSDTWGDASFIWLSIPANFVHVITREIDVYWEYKPRKDALEATVYTRVDDILENEDAIVTGYDLRVAGAS
jgi:hypothetical protein